MTIRTILLSAECVRSDTAAPFIHTRRSPLHTPAFSAGPPVTRLTEKRPFCPTEQRQEKKLKNAADLRPFGNQLVSILGVSVISMSSVTFYWCEVDAQT